ncbi:MAG TPA: hypothetical protein VEP90_08885 [Methylomirabilota bacterium]|nr:hypothetical protein [Methylomirabilota bacterium]
MTTALDISHRVDLKGNALQARDLDLTGNLTVAGTSTISGAQTISGVLPAGTATVAPISYVAGTNLTTAAVGATEFDGKVFYDTALASTRQVVDTEQFVTVGATPTALTNSISTAQNIFPSGSTVVSLGASTTYFFEGFFDIQTGATTHTTALALTASSAVTSILYWAELWSTTAGTISTTAPSVLDVAVTTATVLNATSTAVNTMIRVKGVMRTNAATTITPTITFSAGPTGTCQVNTNSFFRIWPVGTNTVAAVGNWA